MHVTYKKTGPHDFEITYPKVGPFGTPKEELQKIADDLPHKLTVLVSGGADSEVMAKWFAKAGKDVKGVAYRLLYDGKLINEHDLEWVKELDTVCPIVYKDFDVREFWGCNWFWTFITHFKCTSPQLPIHVYLAINESDIYNGRHIILPSIHPEPKHFRDTTFIQEREKDYVVAEFLKYFHHITVSPLRSTPEIIASILSADEFKNFHTFGLVDGRSRKPQQYMDYFGIEIKARPKYHGFEGSEDLDNGMRQKIWNAKKYSEVHMYIPADEMLKNMKTGDFTYSSDKYLKIMYDECHLIGPAQ